MTTRTAGTQRVLLVGLRGAGKTTVGAALARLLGWRHVDTDEWVQGRAQRTIREIFDDEGEERFREWESAALRAALGEICVVVSLGGGVVLRRENRELLRTNGFCVWLTAPTDELTRRVAADPRTAATRPALGAAASRSGELAELLEVRRALYEEVAHSIVLTEKRSIAEIAAEIAARIRPAAVRAERD